MRCFFRVGVPPSPPPPLPLTHSPWSSSPQSSWPSGDPPPSNLQPPHPEAYKEGPDRDPPTRQRIDPNTQLLNRVALVAVSTISISIYSLYIFNVDENCEDFGRSAAVEMRRCQKFKLFSPISPPSPMLVNQSYAFIFSQLEQQVSLKFLNIWLLTQLRDRLGF